LLKNHPDAIWVLDVGNNNIKKEGSEFHQSKFPYFLKLGIDDEQYTFRAELIYYRRDCLDDEINYLEKETYIGSEFTIFFKDIDSIKSFLENSSMKNMEYHDFPKGNVYSFDSLEKKMLNLFSQSTSFQR